MVGLGIAPGDTIGLAFAQPRSFVRGFFASIAAGAVPVPLAPLSTGLSSTRRATIVSVLLASRARWLLVEDCQFANTGAIAAEVPLLRVVVGSELERNSAQAVVPSTPHCGRKTAFLQFTSGSTAAPKGVDVSHESLLANAQASARHLRFDPDRDMMVSWLPLHHDMGLIGFVLTPLVASLSVTLVPTALVMRRVGFWFDAIQRQKGTITFAPNFAFALAYRRLKDHPTGSWDLQSLRVLGCGAEPIDANILELFTGMATRRFGMPATAILPSYGMAEATLAMTFAPLGTKIRVDSIDANELASSGTAVSAQPHTKAVRHVVSCGRPMPLHELRVLGDDGRPMLDRNQGEIVFRGPSVARGYISNSAATKETFRDGWLYTGDLGYVVDGEVYVTGRRKDVIVCSGVKYHAVDIEHLAVSVPGVRPGKVVAFSVPGADTEQIVLVVECPRDGALAISEALAARVRRELGAPIAEVVSIPLGALPRTSSGKVRRSALRAWYLDPIRRSVPE
jgi:fatty-acyl-CoA synthase